MKPDLFAVFKGARVLVTGDTGFKGSWLSLWLHELGAEVLGISLPAESGDAHFELLGLGNLIHHVDTDLRDLRQIETHFKTFRPTFVFHLAAQSLVLRSYEDPKLTFDTNVGGSVNLLECVRASDSLRSVVFVTSDKAYKNREWIWGYRENDELGGRDPYSASKSCAEILLSSYCSSFFQQKEELGIASVRAGNVIGGGDWSADRIVPDCVRAIGARQSLRLRYPKSTRPWQHVLEPLSGYLLLSQRLFEQPTKFSGAWNFGPNADSVRTVEDLALAFFAAWAVENRIEVDELEEKKHEAGLLHLNCEKARLELGWQPQWDFQTTVTETARWYKSYDEGCEPRALSRQQIASYTAAMKDS